MANKLDFDFPSNSPIAQSDGMPTMSWAQVFTRWQFLLNRMTWQNVMSQRALDTPFVNGTGRQIFVNISYTNTVADTIRLDIVDGGDPTITVRIHGSAAAIGDYTTVTAPIPNGATYKVTILVGAPTLRVWAELR